MPTHRPLLLSLSLGAACALALGACGGDDEGTIPSQNAAVLLQSLEDARGERDLENCQGIADAAGNLLTAVDQLPDTVDSEVRTALTEGAENLQSLADDPDECESATGTTGPSGPEDETTDTPDEFTEPPPTTAPEEEEEEPPPDQPSNEGGGGLGEGDQGGRPPPDRPPPDRPPPGGGTGPPTGGTGEDEGDD